MTERREWAEVPALYEIARQVCHEHGMPWTDPRTGITHPPPKRPKVPEPVGRRPHHPKRKPRTK